MPSIIKIKRSGTASGAPASLKSGELSYTYTNGVNRLYFGKGDDGSGNATSIVQIGGEFYTDLLSATAGALTASKALIVDASSKLNNFKVDNIDLDGNTISTTDTNGNLILNPNGTGQLSLYDAYTFPRTLGPSGQALVSNGAGGLTFANVNVASTASNLSGGSAGQIPIQSGAGATAFIPAGTAGQFLQAGTNTATFVSTSTMYVASAVNAEKWATARTVTFTGDTTGTFSIDGSANVSNVNLTIQPNSVALGTDTTGNYVATGATSGFGLSGSTTGENQTFTVTSNATSTNANSTIVFRDGSGNFSANSVGLDSPTQSTSTSTGALRVEGGVGIGGNLYVGGEIVAQKLTIQFTTVTTILVETDDVIRTYNNTQSTSTNSGALQITGGAGIGGNLWVGGTANIAGTITGLITTATNIAGGTAGQLHYQSAPGITTFAGPGTAGQLLVSAGAAAPVYTNTASIYVGSAVNAEKWATARTVTFTGDTTGTFSIDGSANVSNVNLTIQPNSVALGTDTTGNYVATGETSGFGLSGSTTGENQTFTVTSNATSTNANSTIVFRDASGNFSANVITADLVGTANNANDLTGGAAGSLPYQSGVGVTVFLPLGSDGKILQVSTATNAPIWADIDGGTY